MYGKAHGATVRHADALFEGDDSLPFPDDRAAQVPARLHGAPRYHALILNGLRGHRHAGSRRRKTRPHRGLAD
jgi:hypothetical protein